MKKKLRTNRFHSTVAIVIIALTAVIGTLLIVFSKAATPDATLSLSPASGSFPVDTNFTVSVYENSGTQEVNGINIGLDYDESKLQFVSIDKTGGAFPVCTEAAAASGIVKLTCITDFFASPPVQSVTGSKLIAKVTFKALAAVSATPITFVKDYPTAGPDARSAIYLKQEQANIWNGATAGGSYAITASSNTGGNNSGGTGGTGTTNNSGSSGTKTTTSSSGSGTKTTTSSGSGSSNSGSKTSTAPTTSSGANSNVSTTGTIAVKVTDSSGNAVAGAQVWLDGAETKTDSGGVASFSGVAAGSHTVTVKDKKGTATKKITVNSNTTGVVQQFSVQISPALPLTLIAGIAGGLIVLVVLVMLVRNKFAGRKDWHYGEPTSGIVVNGQPVDQGALNDASPTVTETVQTVEPAPAEPAAPAATEKQPTLAEIEESVGAKKTPAPDSKGVVASTVSEIPKD